MDNGAAQKFAKIEFFPLTLPFRGGCKILLEKDKEDFFMDKTCIDVKNAAKEYDGRRVVDGLSFTVCRGEVFGLLGHNGAGKTTTIEMILGLKKSDFGELELFGLEAAKHRKEIFEKVGVQFQSSSYQAAIRVGEVCEEYASLYRKPADYQSLLKQFGLEKLTKSPVMKLSGGERQRLSVVLALIGNPEVIFLDELTTGLDVEARREVWRTLKKLKKQGLTIFLTTHYMEEAEALCDRICILKKGKKVIEGTVGEILQSSPYRTLEEAYLWYMGETVEDSEKEEADNNEAIL